MDFLLNNEMEKIIIDGLTEEEVQQALEKGQEIIEKKMAKEYALVLSGDALIHGIKDHLSKKVSKSFFFIFLFYFNKRLWKFLIVANL